MTLMVQVRGSPYAFEYWDIKERSQKGVKKELNRRYGKEWISAWTNKEKPSKSYSRSLRKVV